jgi:hypothetical protein
MGQSQTFYRFDWSKRLTALQGGVHDFLEPPSVHKWVSTFSKASLILTTEGIYPLQIEQCKPPTTIFLAHPLKFEKKIIPSLSINTPFKCQCSKLVVPVLLYQTFWYISSGDL